MTRARTAPKLRKLLPAGLLLGDAAVIFSALLLGYWLRYHTFLGSFFIEVNDAQLADYLPLIGLGCAFLLITYAHTGLYDERLLLRHYQAINLILRGVGFWFAAYLGVSLVLKFQPPISRLYAVYAGLCTASLLYVWRTLLYRLLIATPSLTTPLRQRTALLGWSTEAAELAESLLKYSNHPYLIAGVIELPSPEAAPAARQSGVNSLGCVTELGEIIRSQGIDVLISARLDLPREELARVVSVCEQAGTELKIIPSVFQVFVTGLRLQTIGSVPVLGVEELALSRFLNRGIKRLADLSGALVGLLLFSPIMVVLALLIKRESPQGPILFRQARLGIGNKEFIMLKLRSMRPGAEASDDQQVSTQAGDERLLRIGAWMRRWNFDELPQLWNVIRGDMSLVGPRPERSRHAQNLSYSIPHYMPRHLVRPGMTGWAQANGLRGECSLERRIQHDLYYIENWSLWLDLQILILTVLRWKNKSE